MIQNKGVYVRVIDVKDALDIYDIRAALERAGVLAASRRIRPEHLVRLRRQVESLDAFEAEGDRENYFVANLEFLRWRAMSVCWISPSGSRVSRVCSVTCP